MTEPEPQIAEYRCPGQRYPISRAVHLGRLARFYPACRQCARRDDTGSLSARQVEQLVETRTRGLSRPLFHEEGTGGVYPGDLGTDTGRDVAAALGMVLQQRTGRSHHGPPVVAMAHDGRAIGCELVASVGEGLRWAGCHVVDIGPASAACLALAIDHLQTDGGVLVGRPGKEPHLVGLKFWGPGPRPLSGGGDGGLESLSAIHAAGVDRPARAFGSLRRFQADVPYLAGLAERYHALRPLRFVLHSSCGPLVRYIKELTEPVACRILQSRNATERLPEEVRTGEAHFGACIDDDGERCRILDERGRWVPPERMLRLLARRLLAERPEGVVVLEEGTARTVAERIEAAGGRVVTADARRAEMAAAMRSGGGIFGGGRTGRFWYDRDGVPLPDALMTLTWLLVLLSQSDRRFSEVLDREAPPA